MNRIYPTPTRKAYICIKNVNSLSAFGKINTPIPGSIILPFPTPTEEAYISITDAPN
jgi:hypothetical protein